MQHREYLDLDLVVEGKPSDGYRVQAVCTAARLSARAAFSMPFTDEELESFVAAVTPGGATRRLAPTVAPPATPEVDVRTMGERLFGAAFTGDLGPCLVESIRAARSDQNKGVRVRLHLADAPELGRIPWEFLFSDFLDRYLALSTDTPVVRFLDVPSAIDPLPVTLPLRVVVVVSDPVDAPGLDVKRETELLKATTTDLQKAGLLSLEFLESATLSNLQHRLYEPMHVFHFIGHGAYDEKLRQGTLLFEDEQRNAVRVSATRLATLLHDAPDLRLAVLNSCEGARGSTTDPFSGVAQTLLRQGLPSAVAMQSEISDRAAIAFAHEFYFALCRGADVDAATSEGRKAVFSAGNDIEWGTPVLFLRSEDARIFEVAEEGAEPSREQHWEALYDGAQSALAADELVRAKSLLEQLAAESPSYKDVTELLPRVAGAAEAKEQAATVTGAVPAQRTPGQVPPGPGWFRGDGPTTSTVAQPVPDPEPHAEPRPVPAPQGWTQQPPPPPHGWTQPPRQPRRRRQPGKRHWGRKVFALVLVSLLAAGVWIGYQAYISYTHTVHAPFALNGIKVDGFDGEWPSGAKTYTSSHLVDGTLNQGVQGKWKVAWDRNALYVFANVFDPDPFFRQPSRPSQMFRVNSVSLELGDDPSKLSKDAPLRTDDVHILIGPVTASSLGVVVNPAGRSGSGSIVFVPGRQVPGIAAETHTNGGYTIEAQIPWSSIGRRTPAAGTTFGANLNVSDADQNGRYRAMFSNNPDRTAANQNRPNTWYLLTLDR
jgi:hypothetical protein